MDKSIAESYTLKTENDCWLAQIVITDDGMFSAVSDWGNFSFIWGAFGTGSFKDFLISIGIDYFASKMVQFISCIGISKKSVKICENFAEKVLPAFQAILKKERSEIKTVV